MIEKLYWIWLFRESLRCVEELIVTLADFFVRDSFIANHRELYWKEAFVGTLIIAHPRVAVDCSINCSQWSSTTVEPLDQFYLNLFASFTRWKDCWSYSTIFKIHTARLHDTFTILQISYKSFSLRVQSIRWGPEMGHKREEKI